MTTTIISVVILMIAGFFLFCAGEQYGLGRAGIASYAKTNTLCIFQSYTDISEKHGCILVTNGKGTPFAFVVNGNQVDKLEILKKGDVMTWTGKFFKKHYIQKV